jgi:hypothetical protein
VLRRHRVWTAASAIMLLGCSCSAGHGSSASRTPKIAAASGSGLDAALLSASDLRDGGLPADVHTTALNDLNLFEDPDPRGPCGAKVESIDLTRGAGVGIAASAVQGAELVVRLDEPAAKAYLGALEADAHDGCAAYQTTTNRGTPQTVTLRTVVALPMLVDGAIATKLTIESSGNATAVTQIVLRRTGTIALTTLFAASPLSDATVRSLALHAAADRAKLG